MPAYILMWLVISSIVIGSSFTLINNKSNRLSTTPKIERNLIKENGILKVQPTYNHIKQIDNKPWNIIRTNNEECRFRRENGVIIEECKKI